ncbi:MULTISPECIES: HAD family hydrolase [Bacillus]|uniref:HAD family hydrolase n=1 Tax=Bacillus TaxID=1386 RepID=UPI00030F98F7|nr:MULTISPECIES: HAD family phosphatase [Bacillus]
MKKYAIFDLDGTLIDSMNVWDMAVCTFLRNKGIIMPNELITVLNKKSFEQGANYLIQQFTLDLTTEEVMAEIHDFIIHQYMNEVQLKPFVLEFLENVENQNIKMCIVTASEKKLAELVLKRLKVLDYFDFILTCGEVGYGKDTPDIFYLAAQKWEANISEIMVFEDSLHAIQTTKAAGFYTIAVYDRSADKDNKMIQQLSDKYISSFEEWRDAE